MYKRQANKQTCLNRVIKRDFLERGKSKDLAKKDFKKLGNYFIKIKRNIIQEIIAKQL